MKLRPRFLFQRLVFVGNSHVLHRSSEGVKICLSQSGHIASLHKSVVDVGTKYGLGQAEQHNEDNNDA